MKVEMISELTIKVTTDAGHQFLMHIPFGSPYTEAYIALDAFKDTVDQMQKNAQDRALEEAAKSPETKE